MSTLQLISKSPKPRRLLQNTYKLNPRRPFDPVKVKVHLTNILELNFKDVEYSDELMRELCLTATKEIMTAVKSDGYDRCRFVINLTLGEKKMQGVHICHSFLWDHEKDKYTEHTYETNNFYVNAVVYGVYYD